MKRKRQIDTQGVCVRGAFCSVGTNSPNPKAKMKGRSEGKGVWGRVTKRERDEIRFPVR